MRRIQGTVYFDFLTPGAANCCILDMPIDIDFRQDSVHRAALNDNKTRPTSFLTHKVTARPCSDASFPNHEKKPCVHKRE